ncbi:hypothetical protein M4D81_28280 [Paenibacillus sp. p3-SID867]|uniref:hypothetical protein n=1 Tax=Paenibacillus sp. p3-SID867 TaxID=2916363 RepID=UPI0021A54C6C|nr:hypothetical protein [Paenibacillus sp. p3-SID867]MCT1402898.1 hypothetical protein [Paenibacillus sp. p3-SID867]
MYHFFDPSIRPVTTTDLAGNIIYVRTHGLHHYGYPDIYLDNVTSNYEELFHSILDKMYSLDFDINQIWKFNGHIIQFEIYPEEKLAKIVFPSNDEIKIITINNPVTDEPYKLLTRGIQLFYNLPEITITAEIPYSREIIEYVLEQIQQGESFDGNSFILYDGLQYDVVQNSDRYGFPQLEIQLVKKSEKRIFKEKGSHLKRVK